MLPDGTEVRDRGPVVVPATTGKHFSVARVVMSGA
ncbi:predicted protein [Streptomyces iranensis]|uniref:Uncharacterized protein n=1 Tax=Streptomyces iranensis TaxID=576784 RepID=A0A060ZR98_9ACTN|nr:predicted protein [Streptomyces iranensis]